MPAAELHRNKHCSVSYGSHCCAPHMQLGHCLQPCGSSTSAPPHIATSSCPSRLPLPLPRAAPLRRVQDWGVVELMRRVAPGLPVHGSTQMSITSAEGAAWAAGLGVERVVVGRELSVNEISKVGGDQCGNKGGKAKAEHVAVCVQVGTQPCVQPWRRMHDCMIA